MTPVETAIPPEMPALLQNIRIGIVAFSRMDSVVTGTLQQAQASFSYIDARVVPPGAAELARFHVLILHVREGSGLDSAWFRPELLRNNVHPLLLAGEVDDILRRASLLD